MDPFRATQSPLADDMDIIERYPLPIARAWQRVLVAAARPSVHHEALLVLAQDITYVLGSIAVAAYQQQDGAQDPTLNRSLRNRRRPTWGQWLGWVRGALAAVPPGTPLLSEMAAAYEAEDSHLLLLGYEGLRGQMVVHLGYAGEYGPRQTASPRLLLELIDQYQLRLRTHPPGPESSWDPMGIVTVIAPGLRAVLGHLRMLADYPLLGLVRDAEGGPLVVRLSGLAVTESGVEMDKDAPAPGTLLLADPDEQPILVLDPWLVLAAHPQSGEVEVAAFAGQEGEQTRYTGLDSGDTWAVGSPPVPATLDMAEGEQDWTPDASVPPESPSQVQAAMFAQWEGEQQAMAAERAQVRGARMAQGVHVTTAEELDVQTQALRQQIHAAGERQIAPEQASVPDEMARLLAEHHRMADLEAEAERHYEDGESGAT